MVGIGLSRPAPAAETSPDATIRILEQTIAWYRQLDAPRQLATESNEALLVNGNQQMANQVVRLVFDFARAEADSRGKEAGPEGTEDQSPGASRFQALQKMSTTLNRQIRETHAEVDSLRQKLTTATGRQRQALQTQIAETQSELELAEARREALRNMTEFVGGSSANGLGATGLRAQIESLARTVPAALAKPSASHEGSASAAEEYLPAPVAISRKSEFSGVWGLTLDLFALSRKIRTLADTVQLTDSLIQNSRDLRTPLIGKLRDMSKRGDDLAKQADSADQTALAQEKKELDALTSQFKRTSASVLPLSKAMILLDLYKRNATNWLNATRSQYGTELRNLILRLVFIVVFLAAVIGAAGLWRRTIFRYVRDARRRYQFLLLRKIVLWCTVAIVLVFSFANEIGSVATFAGLMTAGVALALQSVILSVVGYFFLIGRFGIRVGDRVQVAGVTGEVVEIGLVRFHLLELVSGAGKTPSGRVVAFPNSIVFQSGAGLFKQIPGTNFIWHEISLTLSSDSDYGLVEQRLREAIEAVFSGYREEMERQSRQMERTLSGTPPSALQPVCRLRLTQSCLEAVVRYPVDLHHATDIDDRITRELLKVIDREPKLKLAGSISPGIILRTDLSAPDALPR